MVNRRMLGGILMVTCLIGSLWAQVSLMGVIDMDGDVFTPANTVVFTPDGSRGLVVDMSGERLILFDPRQPARGVLGSFRVGPLATTVVNGPGGRFAGIVNRGDATISILDLTNFRLKICHLPEEGVIPLQVNLSITPDDRYGLIALPHRNQVCLFRLADGGVEALLPVDESPFRVDITPGGDRAVVLCGGGMTADTVARITIVNLPSRSVERSLIVDGLAFDGINSDPADFSGVNTVFSPDGVTAYVCDPLHNDIWTIDLEQPTHRVRLGHELLGEIPGLPGLGPLTISRDGVYLAAPSRADGRLYILDTRNGSDGAPVLKVIRDPDGEVGWLGWTRPVFAADDRTILIGSVLTGSAGQSELLVADADSGQLLGIYPSGGTGVVGMGRTANGRYLAAINTESGSIGVFALTPRVMNFPFFRSGQGEYTGYGISNPSDEPFTIRAWALAEDGTLLPGSRGPVERILAPHAQLAFIGDQFFGLTDGEHIGWIRVVSGSPEATGYFLNTDFDGEFLDGVSAQDRELPQFYLTHIHEDRREGEPAVHTEVFLVNPREEPVELTLELRDRNGVELASSTRTLLGWEMLSGDVESLFFDGSAPVMDLDGYISGHVAGEAGGVIGCARVLHEDGAGVIRTLHALPIQPPATRSTLYCPHLASGGDEENFVSPYDTVFHLVNTSASVVGVTLSLADDLGTEQATTSLQLAAGQQFSGHGWELFGLEDPLNRPLHETGTVMIRSDHPGVIGDVVFGDGLNRPPRFETCLPLYTQDFHRAVFSHVANGPTADGHLIYYNGLSLMNTSDHDIDVSVRVYKPDGELTGENRISLSPGHRLLRLLNAPELVPACWGQMGGYLVLESRDNFVAFEMFTDGAGQSLSAIVPRFESNRAPTDILLSDDTIAENQPAGTLVGQFSSVDPDSGDSHVYRLVRGEGDEDNDVFEIRNDQLVSACSFDYEVRSRYRIRVMSADGQGGTLEKAFEIRVTDRNEAPTLDSPIPAITGTQGEAIDSLATGEYFSDPEGDILTFTITGLPAGTGLVWDPATGTLGGVPTNEDAVAVQPIRLTVTADDGHGGTAFGTCELQVINVNDPPFFTDPIPGQSGTQGIPFGPLDLAGYVTDPDRDPLTFTLTGLPMSTGLVFDSTSGVLSGTPTNDDARAGQPIALTLTVEDGHGGATSAGFSLSISDVNDAPVITEGAAVSVTMSEDGAPTPFALTLNATDVDGDSLSWSLVSPAGHGTATASGAGPALVVEYNPDADYNGSDTFAVQVRDGRGGSDSIAVTVTIEAVNDAPVITEGAAVNVTMSEDGAPTPFALTLNATDVDGDSLNWSLVSPAGHGTATASGVGPALVVEYIPDADYNGSDTFAVRVGDGHGGSDTTAITVTIEAVNDAPVITEGAAVNVTMSEDGAPTPFALTLDATDVDGDSLSWNPVVPAVHGTVAATGAGPSLAVSYTPLADYNGPDSFVVRVVDGLGGMDTITINVTVEPVDDPPTAASDTYSCIGNTLYVVMPGGRIGTPPQGTAALVSSRQGVLANDSDPDSGDSLSVTAGIISTTQGGLVDLRADGSFSYRPPAGFEGEDSFTYTLSDSGVPALTTTGTATVTVSGRVWYIRDNSPDGGDGTSLTPFNAIPDLTAAVFEAGDTIFIYRGDTGTNALDGAMVLQDDQRLVGEANGLTMTNPETGLPLQLVAPGLAPRITSSGGSVVTLAARNTVEGMILLPVTAAGVYGHAASEGNVANVLVETTGMADGIFLDGHTAGFNFTGSIHGTGGAGGSGIRLEHCSDSVTFTDVDVIGMGTGIRCFQNTDCQVGFHGTTTVSTCSERGLSVEGSGTALDSDIYIARLDLTSSRGTAMYEAHFAGRMIIDDGILSHSGGRLVDVDDVTAGLDLSSVSVGTTDHGGVSVRHSSGTFVFPDIVITTAPTEDAVYLYQNQPTTNIRFNRLDVVTNGTYGLYASEAGTVEIADSASRISTTGVSGLILTSTTIGPAGMTFSAIDVSEPDQTGVILSGLSQSGGRGLTVTGVTSVTNQQSSASSVHIEGCPAEIDLGVLYVSTTIGSGLEVNNAAGLTIHSGGVATAGGTIMNISGSALDVTLSSLSGTNVAGDGIILRNNTGTTVLGGLSVTNTSGVGLRVENGGNLTVRGGANTIATTFGSAVEITGTTLSGDGSDDGVEFRSLRATGGTHGILLADTGGGRFVVTGGGGSTAGGDAGTVAASLGQGGTISGTQGDAVSLTGVSHVTLRDLIIGDGSRTPADPYSSGTKNISGNGILADEVSGLVLDNVKIAGTMGSGLHGESISGLDIRHSEFLNAGPGTSPGVAGIRLRDVRSSQTITDTVVAASVVNNVDVRNSISSGMTDSLVLTRCDIHDTTSSATGADGILVLATGTAELDLVVTDCRVSDAFSDGLQADAADSSVLSVSVAGSTFSSIDGRGLNLSGSDSAVVTVEIGTMNGNLFYDNLLSGINIYQGDGSGIFSGDVSHNTIDGSDTGVRLVMDGLSAGPTGSLTVTDNTVRNFGLAGGSGILARARGGTAALHLSLIANSIQDPRLDQAGEGIKVIAGNGSPADFSTVCLNALNNVSTDISTPGQGEGFWLEIQSVGAHFMLQGLAVATTDPVIVATTLAATNLGSIWIEGAGLGVGFEPGSCNLP